VPDLRLGTAAIGDSLEVDDFGEYTEMLVPAINLRNGESTVRIGFAADVPMSSTIIMDDGLVSSTIIKELVLLPSVPVVITPPVAEGTEGTTVPLDSQYKVHVAARKLVQDEVVRRKLASLEANRAWWTDEVCPKLSALVPVWLSNRKAQAKIVDLGFGTYQQLLSPSFTMGDSLMNSTLNKWITFGVAFLLGDMSGAGWAALATELSKKHSARMEAVRLRHERSSSSSSSSSSALPPPPPPPPQPRSESIRFLPSQRHFLMGMAKMNPESLGNPESNKASVRERYDAIVSAIHAVKLGLAPNDPNLEVLPADEKKRLRAAVANWWSSARFGCGTMYRGINANWDAEGKARTPNTKTLMKRGTKRPAPHQLEMDTPVGRGGGGGGGPLPLVGAAAAASAAVAGMATAASAAHLAAQQAAAAAAAGPSAVAGAPAGAAGAAGAI